MTFAIGTIHGGGVSSPALRIAERVYRWPDIAAQTQRALPGSVTEALRAWGTAFPLLQQAADAITSGNISVAGLPERDVVLAKTHDPLKVYCVGANYSDHLIEMGDSGERVPGQPPFFYMKPASTATCGPGKTVEIPDGCEDFDWEGEVVAVFGKGGKNIKVEDALGHIAGYTMGIDFTARDQFMVPIVFRFHFGLGKCQDNTAPIGPWIVPAAFADGSRLPFSLSVNGVEKQNANTAKMLYSLEEQIVEISRRIRIEPGDILFTGSPAGVGHPRGERLRSGDTVVAHGDLIGDLIVQLQTPAHVA